MKKIVLVLLSLYFGTMVFFAQSRHGGAGSALTWHEWASRPEWVKNLDLYDWEYVCNSWTTKVINQSWVPRNVMELIDRQVGRGKDGFVWAYDAYDGTGNVIDIYYRSEGRYIWMMVSKYWFD